MTDSPTVPTWRMPRRAACVALALLVAIQVARFPVASAWLSLGLLGYAAALLWRRDLWLLVLPAALPVLDLAPWSGRQFLDELDLVVLTTLAAWHWQQASQPPAAGSLSESMGTAFPALVVLGLSYGVAALMAWLEPPLPGAGAFCHPYNICGSLRILKGFAWAVLLLAPLRAALTGSRAGFPLLVAGIVTGLLAECLAIAWERHLFTGLFNFDAPFRVTGTFSSLHTGGQHLDAYLAATIPFLAPLVAVPACSRVANAGVAAAGLAVLLLAIYAVVVTFSRGPLVAVAFSLGIVALGTLRFMTPTRHATVRVLVIAAVVAGGGALSLARALEGDFLAYRFSLTSRDAEQRMAHWRDALSLIPSSPASHAVGMGLASYPAIHFRDERASRRAGTYALREHDGDRHVVLTGGSPLFFEQRVRVRQRTRYTFAARLRAVDGPTPVVALLCEKSLRYSVRCVHLQTMAPAGHEYVRVEGVIQTRGVGAPVTGILGVNIRRPVTLALFVHQPAGSVVVDDVELVGPDGRNRIRNGGFADGMDHWHFSADDPDPWHIANLWLHLYFEQGLLGAAAFTVLVLAALARAVRAARAGSGAALVLVASLGGVLLIALLGSLLDAPRVAMLIYLLTFCAALSPAFPRSARGPTDGPAAPGMT